MRIAELSVENRVPMNLLLMVMVVGGMLAYREMPREVFPVVPIDRVAITTSDSGLLPEEVEQEITRPIEEALKGVKGIAHIESSSIEGLSMVEAELEAGRDLKRIAQDIRSQIARIPDLPEEAEDPVVVEIEFEAPIVVVGLSGSLPEARLRELAKALERRIEGIEGVGTVTLGGYRDREIWLELDPQRMNAFGIGILEVIEGLRSRNLALAGGRLKGLREEVLLRTLGKFQNLAQMEDMVIRPHPLGRHIRLRDIGHARLTYEETQAKDRINGEPAITLNVSKRASGDAIRIMEAIEAEAAGMRTALPSGVTISFTQNSAIWIQSRLKTLYINGAIGFVLVCLTLFSFLNWRMALWTAVGIPASFLGAYCLMALLGQTVNMLSLFALILVLGLVVDDAIIVTENVYRHLCLGYSPAKAAVLGTDQVVLPVVATVLTTIAAFIPMLMMSGILGKFMRVIPIVVSLVLVVSLVEALLILPSHLADFAHAPEASRRQRGAEGPGFMRLRRAYGRGLLFVLRHRYSTVIGVILITGGLIGTAAYFQKFVLFGVKDIPGFVVMLETPTGTRLSETARRVAEIESFAATLPKEDVNAVVSLTGRQIDPETSRLTFGSHLGQVYVELADFDLPNRRNGYVLLQEMREKVQGLPGLRSLKVDAIEGGPPVGAAIEVKIRGEDLSTLRSISGRMQRHLAGMAGVYDIRDDALPGKKELQYHIDPDKVARLGLDTASVARALRASIHGEEATQIQKGGEAVKLRVQWAEPYRSDSRHLSQLKIRSREGTLVPLKSVARASLFQGESAIYRKDHRRTVTVLAEVDSDQMTAGEAAKSLENAFSDLSTRHPGYSFEFGGETEEQRKSVGSLLRAYSVTALIIYMILGGLFKSFLQPFIVMFAVPFGIIGVIIGHFVMDQSISLLSLIGVVALSGIVVNDSLLLVEFINQSRAQGVRRWRSIMAAGRIRMRPILLTTLTTILGLLALSFQTTGQAGYLAPMAIAIVWGLFFATGLTLFLVPALFAIGDDMRAAVKRHF